MEKKNSVFIATSLDGYIADRNGGLDWLPSDPDGPDMGYNTFISQVDAMVMGRLTFETVCGFPEWPYKLPVFVLSNSLADIPEEYSEKSFLVKGEIHEVLNFIHDKGYHRLYIDGGKTIQSFLKEDLIDTMIITVVPKLLGSGIPLFSDMEKTLIFECTESVVFTNKCVQNTYQRKR